MNSSTQEAQTAIFDQVADAGVLAVLMIDDADHAVPLAEALLAGGVRAMELTLRTEAALPALRAIRKSVPEMIVGVGTVITPDQILQAQDGDAAFAVSPGVNPAVLEAAANARMPFAPGIATPSDVETAIGFGCMTLKFFPAELLGGLPYLRAIAAPYAHLGLGYIPLGGVRQSNLADYLAEPLVAAVGGSWLAPREASGGGDWATIRSLAEQASATVSAARA